MPRRDDEPCGRAGVCVCSCPLRQDVASEDLSERADVADAERQRGGRVSGPPADGSVMSHGAEGGMIVLPCHGGKMPLSIPLFILAHIVTFLTLCHICDSYYWMLS